MSHKEVDQIPLFETEPKEKKPVTCLGMTFSSDEERRAYFTEKLREKLSELKNMEGFPIGQDEDILALSDPPYYTACPNPFLMDFVNRWTEEKSGLIDVSEEEYHRVPFATDVKEGKNDPIYNAHSYHTKVPHKAIMRYILHYTKPGDIVFDGFAGSGMTGVAALMCGDRESIESLGYTISSDGKIIDEEGNYVSEIGMRKAILTDLAPAATFIAANYNLRSNVLDFERRFNNLFNDLHYQLSWMFLTLKTESHHVLVEMINKLRVSRSSDDVRELVNSNLHYFGKINYVVWSEVFVCSECANEVIFSEVAIDPISKEAKDEFVCPNCNALLTKKKLERAWTTFYDQALKQTIRQAKQVPVLINYSVDKKRFEKVPDEFDLMLLEFINNHNIADWFPANRMAEGGETRRNDSSGITHVHHFYTKRVLWILSEYLHQVFKLKESKREFLFLHGSVLPKLTKMNRYMPQHGSRALVGPMANTLYVPPLSVENNVLDQFEFQFKKIVKALTPIEGSIISTQSATQFQVPNECVDYIFLDPPFGANIMYSELSFIRESWLKILTNNKMEAIQNKHQGKSLDDYRLLMTKCFEEAYRILKPGRWMTVEFSNTQASVWNSLQYALEEAGFIVASVDALDKQRGGLHSMIGTTAVKRDLVISAYKPDSNMSTNFFSGNSVEEDVWSFVANHLKYLPVFRGQRGVAEFIVEREPRLLYERLIAYFVRNGTEVPLSAYEFQNGLTRHFVEKDGMIFKIDQVAEYDKKRLLAKEFTQMDLFISNENSAIEWLRQQLMKKPQTYQEIQPNYMKEIQGINKYEKLPELIQLLEQNFLQYEGEGPVPSQIHSYLSTNFKDLRELDKESPALKSKAKGRWYIPDPNKVADLEKLREKTLLREFTSYVEEMNKSKKKLKQFRLEAIRAGFKKAWSDKDYQTIVQVGERLPESVLQEDDKLLMYFDNAQTRLGM
jgi:DNA modification methylase/DNA-directed RNA polymerase subunit RPC12/RpoP